MRRREFIACVGGAVVWPVVARAQQSTVPVIGVLSSLTGEASRGFMGAFRRGLSDSGYDEGRSVLIEYRWAEGQYSKLPALAADLVALHPAVIVCRFGGERPWFLCDCGRRVVALYAGQGGFACRSCHGLSYQSQRVTDCERTASKARKIRFRLDGTASLVEPFPARPKGMHRKRYARLWRDYQQAATCAYSPFDLSIQRLTRKIGN
jgi:hypothetical protein